MTSIGRGILLAASLALAGCTPPPFVSPAEGGAVWTKLVADHFTVYTDMPLREAETVAHDLQDAYNALQDIAFPYEPRARGRFEVTLFHHEDAFRKIAANADVRGYFQRDGRDPEGRAMMVLYHGLDPALRTVVQHELVHRFVAFYFPGAPRWLNEGLAMYYETLLVDDDKVRVGFPPNGWSLYGRSSLRIQTDRGVTEIAREEMPNLSAVISLDRGSFDPGGSGIKSTKQRWLHYAASWNLIHAMYLGPPPFPATLDAYLVALSAGANPHDAWEKVLESNGVSPASLETQYQTHIDRYRTQYGTLRYTPRPRTALHSQPMTEAEVRVLWARIRPWKGENLARAGLDLDAAINADPRYAAAYSMRGLWFAEQHRDAEALVDLRKATAIASDDFRTIYTLGSFLQAQVSERMDHSGELGAELRTVIDRLRDNSGSAAAWNLVAWYDANHAQPNRGLPFAKKAVAADASCYRCYDTAAILLYELHKYSEAVAAEHIAIQLVPDGIEAPEMVDRLRRFERALAASTQMREPPLPE